MPKKEKLLSEEEDRVLKKYKTRRSVDEGDGKILEKWGSIGFVSYGLDFDTMNETAELTNSGKAHLGR
jgi:hypothetical protein